MNAPPVLVVGAGPTGLTLACTLLRFGVPCRVVDRRPGLGAEPKALILWSGALEALRRTGVSEPIEEQALPLRGASYWARRRRIGRIGFGGLAETAFPAPLCLPQPAVEQALHGRLVALGGSVEWGVEAVAAAVMDDGVAVELRDGGRAERLIVPWLIAADGTHSRMRSVLDIPFEGRTYDRVFLLGDGVVDGGAPDAEAQYHLGPDGVLVLVPLPGGGHRVFFDIAPDTESAAPDIALLQRLLDDRGPGTLRIRETWWTSRFRVHAKVAARFRHGRAFLAGDAAHCHSPAGGQGLNTGVQDGYDLGWKLAAVLRGADPALLDSYEAERRPASVRAVRNAHRQTRLWLLRSRAGTALRDRVMGVLSRRGVLERRIVPELAQLDLDHRASPAVADLAGRRGAPRVAEPGRRMPDAALRPLHGTKAGSLHDYLAAGRHTILVADPSPAGELAHRAWAVLTARGVTDAVDLLWIRPATGGGGDGVDPATGFDVARELGSVLTGRPEAWLGYVRPDGVLGARAAADRLDRLLDPVPSAGAPV